jgi:thioredoxin-dependent peroxiredoxin
VRDALPKLKALDVAVFGISPDTEDVQRKFHEKLGVGFPLLCDTEHRIAAEYGVWGEKEVSGKKVEGVIRSSFLIDEEGKIAYAWYKISPQDTVPALMKVLEQDMDAAYRPST